MKKERVFSRFIYWLKNSELFARPSKQLPGRWELYEYYTESGENLIHIEEAQLKDEHLYAHFDFLEDGKFSGNTNLPEDVIAFKGEYSWSIAKNFVTLIHESNFRNNEEYQFAIVKETLKLLQKDSFGKIIFFGFFRKLKDAGK